MMHSIGKFVLTLGALAMLASPAWAQGRGGFGGGGAGFLMAPNVQKDLRLSDEQIGKIPETLRASREKYADDYAAIRDASPEDRPAKQATLNKTVNEEVKKALALSSEQSKRFDQISLQASGLGAFSDSSVASKLGLTEDQKTKIRAIGEAARSAAPPFNKDASEDERAAATVKRAQLSKENVAKVHALLTASQKQSWNELTGAPVEINTPPFRRPNN